MTSEIIFWCIAGLMLAAAVFFIAAAFARTRFFCGEQTSEQANRRLLNEELEVLKKERAAGLISDSIYEESVDDVRRRALEELPEVRQVQAQDRHKIAVMVCVCLFVVAGALALYLQIGAPGMIAFVESQRTHGLMRADGTLAAAAPQYDAQLMEAYLKRNPNDERAWVLLARLYVKELRPADNGVVLCENEHLFSSTLEAHSPNFIPFDRLSSPLRLRAKVRYRMTEQPCTLEQTGPDTLLVRFDAPQRAITPGQAVVFYDGDLVVGGATIWKGAL